MPPDPWALEAARVLSYFHRAGLLVGAVVLVAAIVRHWGSLNQKVAPIGPIVAGALGGLAIPEAAFLLYWSVVVARPYTDIPDYFIATYVYVGGGLSIIMAVIGLRAAFDVSS